MSKPKKVINLYGGPGTGKSTVAALLFAKFKNMGLNTELVTEYVKGWVYDNRTPVMYDQYYFFAKQMRREYSLFNHIDYIVTDSPMLMNGYYSSLYGTKEEGELFEKMCKTYFKRCKTEDNVEHIHIFLKRVKPFNQIGRFQNEERSKEMDLEIFNYLTNINIPLISIDANEESIDKIIEKIF